MSTRTERLALPLLLVLGMALRLVFFTGVTGARDDWNEYHNSVDGLAYFGDTNWYAFNRLAIILPKKLIFSVLGPTNLACALFTLVCSVLSILVVYGLAQRLFGSTAAIWSALCMVVSPFDLGYASSPYLTDIPLSLACALMMLAAAWAAERPSPRRLLVLALASWWAYRTKMAALLMLIPTAWLGRDGRTRLGLALAAALGPVLDLILCRWLGQTGATEWPGVLAVHKGTLVAFQWDLLGAYLRQLAWGDMAYGLLPWAAALSLIRLVWNARRSHPFRRQELAVTVWFVVWLLALGIKPAGWSQGCLMVFHHHQVRYDYLLVIPGILMLVQALRSLPRGLASLAALGLAFNFLQAGFHNYCLNADHRRWMQTMAAAIDTLPRGATLVVDEGVWVWSVFIRPDWTNRLQLVRVDASDRPATLATLEKLASGRGPVFVMVGGPRGRDTPDVWRLHRSDLPDRLVKSEIWSQTPKGGFDGYYTDSDRGQLLRLGQSVKDRLK